MRGAADIQRAVSALADQPHAGVLVLPNPASASHRDLIIGLASRLRLPAIYPFRYYALAATRRRNHNPVTGEVP